MWLRQRQPELPSSLHRPAASGRVRRGWLIVGVLIAAVSILSVSSVVAQEDYERAVSTAPQPDDIGDGYELPAAQHVSPRSPWWYAADVVLLVIALVLVGMIAHRWRRRWMAVAVTVFCLGYFGFFRQGCVCPIGSIQNVTASLSQPDLAIPFVVILFFLLPLIAALLVGRVFCGGVCPLGAIQDLVLLRPVQLPHAVDRWGGKLRFVYLAAAVWFAAQLPPARDFIICRFDPFVGFFRLQGSGWMLTSGGVLLLVGTVVGRPYCRFLCPYGGLLSLVSRFGLRTVSITPDEELDCGLCSESCPFGAIRQLRADSADCMACARCFAHCPRQQYAWGEIELVEIEQLLEAGAADAAEKAEVSA